MSAKEVFDYFLKSSYVIMALVFVALLIACSVTYVTEAVIFPWLLVYTAFLGSMFVLLVVAFGLRMSALAFLFFGAVLSVPKWAVRLMEQPEADLLIIVQLYLATFMIGAFACFIVPIFKVAASVSKRPFATLPAYLMLILVVTVSSVCIPMRATVNGLYERTTDPEILVFFEEADRFGVESNQASLSFQRTFLFKTVDRTSSACSEFLQSVKEAILMKPAISLHLTIEVWIQQMLDNIWGLGSFANCWISEYDIKDSTGTTYSAKIWYSALIGITLFGVLFDILKRLTYVSRLFN
ncbi:MAG: hypothetical protein AAF636_08555 [Pseudomonadota bacterium]